MAKNGTRRARAPKGPQEQSPDVRVNLTLTQQHKDRLNKLAHAYLMNQSELLRHWIDQAWKEERSNG